MKKKTILVAVVVLVVVAAVLAFVLPGALRQRRYDAALALTASGDYAEAASKWAELGDYKDSARQHAYAELQDDLDNARYESALGLAATIADFPGVNTLAEYARGMAAMQEERYSDAVAAFAGAGDTRDSATQMEAAQEKVNEENYALAERHMRESAWLAAHALYSAMPDYLDSEALAQKSYDIWCDETYVKALKLLLARDNAAGELFASLGAYLDSESLAAYCADGEAGIAYAALLHDESLTPRERQAAYEALGDYHDAKELGERYKEEADALDYEEASGLMDARKWADALAALESIPGYLDADVLAILCHDALLQAAYEEAVALRDKGAWEEAYEAFEKLSEFKDSRAQALICRDSADASIYEEAVSLFDAGDTEPAKALFEKIQTYEDSLRYLESINAGQ